MASGGLTLFAQTNEQPEKSKKQIKKEMEAARDSILFRQAVEALEEREFVLEADRVEFKRGRMVYVTPSTNFVSVKGDQATIQLSFNNTVRPGPNGIGGITVDGRVSNYQVKTDKKGNITVTMMVQGVAVSAQLTFQMFKGTNKCTATVNPNFNSYRTSFTGTLYPAEESNVFKGRSI